MSEARQPAGRHGGPGGFVPGEKAKNFSATLRKLLNSMGRYKIGIAVVILFALFSTAFHIIGPKVLSLAITEIFEGLVSKVAGTGGIRFDQIGRLIALLLGLYLFSSVFSWGQGWIMSGISQRLAFRFRQEISEKIHRMPMRYFESRTVGEVLSRVTNDVDTLGQSLNQSVTQLVTSVTMMVGVLLMMLSISPLMTAMVFLMLPIAAFLISRVIKLSQKYFSAQQKALGDINGQVEEVFTGHSVIQAFNRKEAATETFDQTNDLLFQSAWKSQFLSGLMQPVMMFVGNLGYVAVAVLGSVLAVKGVIRVGDIQAFIQYVRNFTQPIMQIAQVSNLLQSTVAAAERVFEFLEEAEEDVTVENPVRLEKMEGRVQFEHVRFGYREDKIIVKNFTCDVEPGQMVAIVGPTGAGKTTMVKLLLRYYDVNGGCIRVDGHDVRDFNRSELREGFGMVLQDTWLFKGSIMENIRYGRLDASDEEVVAAAKAAHAHHFIQGLPGGYEMELNEEASNVSQGQKQLLTIARAILADNRIMILDEATSSVDTRTEVRIQKAMRNLMQGRTSFVIAHRLSTIKDADVILVMRDGDIIEQGTHEALLEKKGFYADLYNSQFESAS